MLGSNSEWCQNGFFFFFWLLHNSPKDGHSGFDKHIKGFQEHFVGKGRQVVVYTRCLPKK